MKPAKYVSRAEWGASSRGANRTTHPISNVYGVTCHWEGPGMGNFSHSVCARKVRTIQRFHKSTRGWADIAYSAIVCPHGYVFEGRGPNVATAANGTSAIGGNDHWYAVCYLGGVGDGFTDEAADGFRQAVAWLRVDGGAGAKVNGHRDHHPTACPGDEIYSLAHAGAFSSSHGAGVNIEEDDMQTSDKIARWTPEGDEKGDELTVGMTLNQARGYAERSFAHARAASAAAARTEAAVAALAKAMGPTVEEAVRAAIADAVVDVDVTVHGAEVTE